MNSRQRKTLAALLADPVSAAIAWRDIESLLKALDGCDIVEGSGSRVSVVHRPTGIIAGFHRPHQGKEAKRYQIRDAREFLKKIGAAS